MDVIDARGANGVHMYHTSTEGDTYLTMQGRDVEKFYEAVVSELFDVHADLKHFGWQQYSMTCRDDGYFHPFDAYTQAGLLEVNGWIEAEWYGSDDGDAIDAEALSKRIDFFLDQFNGLDLYMMFGNDAEITVSRHGIFIAECVDHD